MPTSVRGTGGVNFCWQDKRRLMIIEESLPGRSGATTLLVYFVLTWMANDAGDKRFSAYIDHVARKAHIGRNAAARAIKNLENLHLLVVTTRARKPDGTFHHAIFELTKGRSTPRSIDEMVRGDSSHSDAIPVKSLASASDAVHAPFVHTTSACKERKEKESAATASSGASGQRKAMIEQAFVERGVVNCNPDVDRALEEFMMDATDETILSALRAAGEQRCPSTKLIKWVRRYIENEKTPLPRRSHPRMVTSTNRYAPPSLRHLEAPPDVWD